MSNRYTAKGYTFKLPMAVKLAHYFTTTSFYCATVSRPLISVGQMKSMLDLRFVWNDSSPLLLGMFGGLSYVLFEATIFHNLPVITSHEMMALLEAVHTFTATGALWNAATWSEKLWS